MAKVATHLEGIPVSGKWTWKEDPTHPSLEFISNNPGADKQDKRRRVKAIDGKSRADRATSGIQRGGMLGRGMIQKFHKPALNKKEQNEHARVTLEDVKNVSLERMSEVYPIPDQFDGLYRKERFDSFLIHLLNYFNCFFNKMGLEHRKNPMFIEPSLAEKVEHTNACQRLAAAEKLLGRAYSLLLLGLELEKQHHMECGRSRVSKTDTDRGLYETFYNFCAFLVWITFRRKEFDGVQKEIGRLLRSDTFNPALRARVAATDTNAADPRKVSKKEETGQDKRLSLAEYRRLYQKRPAIKSIINQRSPAIVSILPLPREEAYWLFRRPKLLSDDSNRSAARDEYANDSVDEKYTELRLDIRNFKAGILGESYRQINPQTLASLGTENEEEGNEGEDAGKGLSEDEGDKEDKSQTSEPGISRQQTAISRATTEAFTDDEIEIGSPVFQIKM